MKLKMPGLNGVITICGNIERSLTTELDTKTLAIQAGNEALAAEGLADLRTKVDNDDVNLAKHTKSTSFQPDKEIQKFQVHLEDPAKMASMGTGLDPT